MSLNGYKITFKLSNGSTFSVESPAGVESFQCDQIKTAPGEGAINAASLRGTAEKVYQEYQDFIRLKAQKGKRNVFPMLLKKGAGLQVVACFVAGYSIDGATSYLSKHSDFNLSRSSIARVFRCLTKIGAYRSPVKVEVAI